MRIALFANTDWYLYNFRLSLAQALREHGAEVLLLAPEGVYLDKLRQMGFSCLPVPMQRRSLNPLREIRLVRWLSRALREQRIELVHGFTLKCAVYASIAARFAGHIPAVSSVAGLGFTFTSDRPLARVLRLPVRAAMSVAFTGPGVRIIVQNHDDLDFFQHAAWCDDERLRLIRGSGVNCRRFAPAAVIAEPGDEMCIVMASRLLLDKGLVELMAAAQALYASECAVQIVVAGEADLGNPNAVSTEQLTAWRSLPNVKFLGHVDDMLALYQSADVCVLPSYREGLPKSLIEAGACGLALVSCDVPGCREVVMHELNGLLVSPGDAPALARALQYLHDNPQQRVAMGEAARTHVQAHFSEEQVVRETLDVYRELIPLG